jgi:hypothetical protein
MFTEAMDDFQRTTPLIRGSRSCTFEENCSRKDPDLRRKISAQENFRLKEKCSRERYRLNKEEVGPSESFSIIHSEGSHM